MLNIYQQLLNAQWAIIISEVSGGQEVQGFPITSCYHFLLAIPKFEKMKYKSMNQWINESINQ